MSDVSQVSQISQIGPLTPSPPLTPPLIPRRSDQIGALRIPETKVELENLIERKQGDEDSVGRIPSPPSTPDYSGFRVPLSPSDDPSLPSLPPLGNPSATDDEDDNRGPPMLPEELGGNYANNIRLRLNYKDFPILNVN